MDAFVMPGQGAQKPGLLTPWLALPRAQEYLDICSASSGLDLLALGTQGDSVAIAGTAVAQPLLTATALLALTAVPPSRDRTTRLVAGHSVGELVALAAAGVLSAVDAVSLAAIRGRAMARACEEQPTAMAAILGGGFPSVARTVADLDLEAANINGAGQLVVAGTVGSVDALVAGPPAGAKVKRLAVAGAFHTRFMASATADFARGVAHTQINDPRCLLLSNVDGRTVTSGAEALRLVVRQITNPVRWDLCMESMARLGVTNGWEFPPSGTLTGLARRALPDVHMTAIQSPTQCMALTEVASS